MLHAEIRLRLPRLIRLYRLLFRDAAEQFRHHFFWPLLAGGVGIVLQASTIAFLFNFVSKLVRDQPYHIAGLTLHPRESIFLLGMVALVSFVFLGISAFCSYFYYTQAVAMSCRFERRCVQGFFQQLAESRSFRVPVNKDEEVESALMKMALSDTRACGRTFLMAFSAVIPFLTFLTSACVLLWVDWVITLMLFVVALFFAGALYRVNIFGVESSRNLERSMGKVREEFRDMISLYRGQTLSSRGDRRWNQLDQKGHLDQYLDSYGALIGLSYRSSLVSDLFLAITLATVFFGITGTAISDHYQWNDISIYLLALLYSVRNLKQTLNRFTLMNRFYPQVSRFFDFRSSLARMSYLKSDQKSLAVVLHSKSPFGPRRMEIARGKPALLSSVRGVSRFNAQDILDGVFGAPVSNEAIRPFAILDAEAQSRAFSERCFDEQFIEELRRQNAEQKGVLSEILLALPDPESVAGAIQKYTIGSPSLSIPRKTAFSFAILATFYYPCDFVFVNSSDLALLNSSEWQRTLSFWKERFLLVVRKDLSIPSSQNFPISADTPWIVMGSSGDLLWVGTSQQLDQDRKLLNQNFKKNGTGAFEETDEGVELEFSEI